MIRICFLSAAVLGVALAQEPPQKPDGPPPPPSERPPLPPGEERERPPRGPQGREGGEHPDRPPFPPPGAPPGGERRPEGYPPRDGHEGGRGPEGRGSEGRRFGGDFRSGQPGFPGGEPGAQPRMKPTPYLGIITTAAPPALSAQLGLTEGFGLVVEEVLPDSPAKTSGLQRFDVLKQLNDQQLLDPMQLGTLVRSLGKDTEVTLTLLRKGQEQRLTIKIGEKEMPERRMEDIRSPFGSPSGSPFGGPEGRRGGEAGRGSGDQGREYQDRVRLMEEKLRDYQRSLNEWQEKVKKWHEKPEGEMPPRPPLPTVPSQESPRRPTGANEPGDGSFRTTRDQARVTLRDRDGEAELNTKDGQRTLTVRSSTGDVIFTGPVDTAEQRNAMPEDYRRKLQSLEAVPPPPPAGQRNQNRPAAPPPQQPDRQGEPKRSATPI